MKTDATLLDPTCCVCLHGTTTMFALVGKCCVWLKFGQTFRFILTDATSLAKNPPTTCNNVVTCCARLHGPESNLIGTKWYIHLLLSDDDVIITLISVCHALAYLVKLAILIHQRKNNKYNQYFFLKLQRFFTMYPLTIITLVCNCLENP